MDAIKKFQDLVKALFQFETSDLDFGIYRILNYKRDQIKKFIEKRPCKTKFNSAFSKSIRSERLININQKIWGGKKRKIIQSLGKRGFYSY